MKTVKPRIKEELVNKFITDRRVRDRILKKEKSVASPRPHKHKFNAGKVTLPIVLDLNFFLLC